MSPCRRVSSPQPGSPCAGLSREAFAQQGKIQVQAAPVGAAGPASEDRVVAFASDLGNVKAKPVACWLILAYDDLYSIQYMHKNLRPYWRRTGWDAADLLKAAKADYSALVKRCKAFDAELMEDLTRAGGVKYAQIAALAYRQCFAAGKFVADDKGRPLQFCKENHSNGCIGTSDVFLSDGAAISAFWANAGQVIPGAIHELRRQRPLEIPVRAA